jgi:hypothetical protein
VAVNADGESKESPPSNPIIPAAPLPDGWIEQKTAEGKIYYVNKEQGITSWQKPEEDKYVIDRKLKKIISEEDIRR